MTFKYKVLSIDGGGIRGIIPAMILAEIEQRTGKRIHEMFNLIAGTSTGGMIALGLTMPSEQDSQQAKYYAKDLVELYKEQGQTIFQKNGNHLSARLHNFLKKVLSSFSLPPINIDDLLNPKFPSTGRDSVVTQYFGNTPIEKALTEVFITSYDTELRVPIFFISNRKKQVIKERVLRKICEGFTMKQAAMATSAAPTFFEPYQVNTTDPTERGYYSLIDGGVFANNPTSLAVMEALIDGRRVDKELRLEDILVISLGTGSLTRKYTLNQTKGWGLIGWIQPLINILMDGTNESVAVQLEQLLPRSDERPPQYYRFQGLLDPGKGNDDMDDATPRNISNLEGLAKQIMEKQQDELTELCELLK
jgi:patatin-like phospholipase/acyl hydrolase